MFISLDAEACTVAAAASVQHKTLQGAVTV